MILSQRILEVSRGEDQLRPEVFFFEGGGSTLMCKQKRVWFFFFFFLDQNRWQNNSPWIAS